jgi:hypothetical protein
MNALTLITSLGKDGKTPVEIARELHTRGVTTDHGKTISTAMVEGFLRFAGISTGAGALPAMERVTGAVWGSGGSNAGARTAVTKHRGGDVGKSAKRNKHTPSDFSDAQKAEISRLYFHENMKGGDIAKKLGLRQTTLNMFLGSLAGFSVPPGEITEYIDDQGRRIVKLPPGYARGAYPQRNVGGAN